MTCAFDCDGTLKDVMNDKPRREIVDLLIALKKIGARIVVWSGGGASYAEHVVRWLHIEEFVDETRAKPNQPDPTIDVSFDDQLVNFAKVNAHVPVEYNGSL